jgi:hypothetical protein
MEGDEDHAQSSPILDHRMIALPTVMYGGMPCSVCSPVMG